MTSYHIKTLMDVHVSQLNGNATCDYLSHMHNVEEMLENVYGDNVPPRLMLNVLLCKKNTNIYCKAKIILKKKNHGILAPCYYGSWCDLKRTSYKVHKLWFCHDNFNHRSRSQGRIHATQICQLCLQYGLCKKEMISFNTCHNVDRSWVFFYKQLKCLLQNLFGDGSFALINILTNAYTWLISHNNKSILCPTIFKL